MKDMYVDMRSFVNRKKKSDPIDFISNFLEEKKTATLGEIYKEIQIVGFLHSKPAIFKILKKMVKDEKIENEEPKNKHPRYSNMNISEFRIKREAYAFKDQICANSLRCNVKSNELDRIKSYPNNFQKKIISETIFKFGLISFYTYLSSYRRSMSVKNSIDENKKLHGLWLRNAMSFENNIQSARFSKLLDVKLRAKLENRKSEIKINEISKNVNEEDMDCSIEEVTQQEMIDTLKDFEKVFSKMFPKWYEVFQISENLIDTKVNALMRKVCIKYPEYLLL